jgi:hypothetical protein
MELEVGFSGVGRSRPSGQRRASDVGAHLSGGACTSDGGCAGLDLRVDAHASRDVGDHAFEDAGSDGVAGS